MELNENGLCESCDRRRAIETHRKKNKANLNPDCMLCGGCVPTRRHIFCLKCRDIRHYECYQRNNLQRRGVRVKKRRTRGEVLHLEQEVRDQLGKNKAVVEEMLAATNSPHLYSKPNDGNPPFKRVPSERIRKEMERCGLGRYKPYSIFQTGRIPYCFEGLGSECDSDDEV